MKKILLRTILFLLIAGIITFGFLAFFYRSIDSKTKTLYDGLGRELSEPPMLIQFFIDNGQWAGLGWHLLDIIVVFGGIYIITKVVGAIENL